MGEMKHTPGPWRIDLRCTRIVATNAKIGGDATLFDVRGWGYLTGHGHGGLAMSEIEAIKVQMANATLAAAAPDLAEALRETQSLLVTMLHEQRPRDEIEAQIIENRAALSKAEGRSLSSASGQEGGE